MGRRVSGDRKLNHLEIPANGKHRSLSLGNICRTETIKFTKSSHYILYLKILHEEKMKELKVKSVFFIYYYLIPLYYSYSDNSALISYHQSNDFLKALKILFRH